MNNVQRVLLIDDDYLDFEETLREDFQQNQITLHCCGTKDDAITILDSGINFDVVILDWYLEEQNHLLSLLVLKHLQNRYFIPVFIWSNHISNYDESVLRDEISYPKALITAISKENVSSIILEQKISQWFQQSLTAQISNVYRQVIRGGIEKVFFDLMQLPNQDIAALLKFLIGEEENIDWSNDFILNLIHRELVKNTRFTGDLKQLLRNARDFAKSIGKDEKRRYILNKMLYYESDATMIRNGDIVRFDTGKILKYGIVITPACDIEQGSTKYLELIELQQFDNQELALKSEARKSIKEFKEPSWHLFPALSIENNLIDFVAIFKSKIIIQQYLSEEVIDKLSKSLPKDKLDKFNEMRKYPKTPKQMEYKDIFLFQGKEIVLSFICSFDDPYKNDFLQKLYSHNSRAGIPDIKKL